MGRLPIVQRLGYHQGLDNMPEINFDRHKNPGPDGYLFVALPRLNACTLEEKTEIE